MRFYTFIHWMLRPIQQGIQSEHVLQEMFNKYVDETNSVAPFKPGHKTLFEWSRNHKTAIVLNGGVSKNLKDLCDFLHAEALHMEQELNIELPWATFSEDEYSLDNMMTGVGIVLPEQIYDAIPAKKMAGTYEIEALDVAGLTLKPNWWYWVNSKTAEVLQIPEGSATALFLNDMKACPLAA